LTAGVVLQSTIRAIKRQSSMAKLQGDIRVAVPAFYKLARTASRIGVSVPAEGASNWVFTVTNLSPSYLSIYRADNSLVANASGKNLVYERGVGNKILLSSGWVTNFLVIRATNSMAITLELNNTNDSLRVDCKAFFRN